MPAPTSRSPTPTPLPPTASTPGPRATALSSIFHVSLDATLKRLSYANFATCFPTPALHVPENLDAFHRDFVSRLGEVCRAQFAGILEERDVVAGLNELDRLVGEARRRKEAGEGEVAMHGLPPEVLLRAHLAGFLGGRESALEERLEEVRAGNRVLAEAVSEQRREIEALVKGLEGVVKDLEEAAGLVQEDAMEGVSGEIRGIEEELRTA
ncbi:hypothetical protein W97_08801 [Coniosporium apollinis CBS 100218]|uniref:MIND kinetochore complex component Nnf1 n=1 Tax=Coniosporium apollinis (strain CBS 100218) TaxID=1168221 RepID=R7Z6I6_CONA1|nr:uncharacterized protein W97_08801 [Coniosporium apollinis CBS 100218]EON69541.1 hypothetical protein W97_08801 [Coniosporium apollinis CBS 100218]